MVKISKLHGIYIMYNHLMIFLFLHQIIHRIMFVVLWSKQQFFQIIVVSRIDVDKITNA